MAVLVAALTATLLPLLGAAAAASVTATSMATSSWQLASVLSTIDALELTSGPRPHSLLTGLFDEASGLCGEGVWHNAWLGVGRLLAARELRRAGNTELADEQGLAAQDAALRLSFAYP